MRKSPALFFEMLKDHARKCSADTAIGTGIGAAESAVANGIGTRAADPAVGGAVESTAIVVAETAVPALPEAKPSEPNTSQYIKAIMHHV